MFYTMFNQIVIFFLQVLLLQGDKGNQERAYPDAFSETFFRHAIARGSQVQVIYELQSHHFYYNFSYTIFVLFGNIVMLKYQIFLQYCFPELPAAFLPVSMGSHCHFFC